MARQDLIEVRRGSTAEWTGADPVLAAGEPGLEVDGDGFYLGVKVGDGNQAWTNLLYVGSHVVLPVPESRDLTPADIGRLLVATGKSVVLNADVDMSAFVDGQVFATLGMAVTYTGGTVDAGFSAQPWVVATIFAARRVLPAAAPVAPPVASLNASAEVTPGGARGQIAAGVTADGTGGTHFLERGDSIDDTSTTQSMAYIEANTDMAGQAAMTLRTTNVVGGAADALLIMSADADVSGGASMQILVGPSGGGALTLLALRYQGGLPIVTMPNLPGADPHVTDQLWNNAGVLTVSAG